MENNQTENPVVRFPENEGANETVLAGNTPNNPVDKVADFLPRALSAIREYFRESIFLFGLVGYIFIAAFGHMEKMSNYLGYFTVILIYFSVYTLWNKIKKNDVVYIFIIILLITYISYTRYGNLILELLKK
jgi:cobalamin biosynthesis protein CbiD